MRGRIESILNWAKVRGHRDGENPARWKGHLQNLLPTRGRGTQKHHAALAWREVPALIGALRARGGDLAEALELAILCASRISEVLDAHWVEFDLDRAVWVLPPERMKARREHRVVLSKRAVELLTARRASAKTPRVFPTFRPMQVGDLLQGGRHQERDRARSSRELPNVGRGVHLLPARNVRDRPIARGRRRDRARLSAQRPSRSSAADDGRLGDILWGRIVWRQDRSRSPLPDFLEELGHDGHPGRDQLRR